MGFHGLICVCLGLAVLAGQGRASAQAAAPATVEPATVAPPPVLASDPPEPPTARHRRKQVLMIVGLAVLGGGYVSTAGTYFLSQLDRAEPYSAALLIPIAGPWITLGTYDFSGMESEWQLVSQLGLGLQGVLQGAGLVLSIIGIAQYIESAPPGASEAARPAVTLTLSPAEGGAQAVLRGVF